VIRKCGVGEWVEPTKIATRETTTTTIESLCALFQQAESHKPSEADLNLDVQSFARVQYGKSVRDLAAEYTHPSHNFPTKSAGPMENSLLRSRELEVALEIQLQSVASTIAYSRASEKLRAWGLL